VNVSLIRKRSIAAALLSIGLAVAGLAAASPAAASPATAAKAAPQSVVVPYCPDSYVCFYPFKNFGGHQGKVSGDNPNFSAMSHTTKECNTGTWNDCIESVSSSGKLCTVRLYVNANYKGHYHTLSPGDAVYDFGIVYSDNAFNDQISSNKWC
jgi:hypothetical protein